MAQGLADMAMSELWSHPWIIDQPVGENRLGILSDLCLKLTPRLHLGRLRHPKLAAHCKIHCFPPVKIAGQAPPTIRWWKAALGLDVRYYAVAQCDTPILECR